MVQLVAHRLETIERTSRTHAYGDLPPAVKREAAKSGVQVSNARYMTYRPSDSCRHHGYPDDADTPLYLGHENGEFPGCTLRILAGRGESLDAPVRSVSSMLVLPLDMNGG